MFAAAAGASVVPCAARVFPGILCSDIHIGLCPIRSGRLKKSGVVDEAPIESPDGLVDFQPVKKFVDGRGYLFLVARNRGMNGIEPFAYFVGQAPPSGKAQRGRNEMVDHGGGIPLHEAEVFLDKPSGQIEQVERRLCDIPALVRCQIVELISCSCVQLRESGWKMVDRKLQYFSRTRCCLRQSGKDASVMLAQ